jgi:hypothetical protein
MTAGERNPFDLPSDRDSRTPANGNGRQCFPTRPIHFDAQKERKVNLRLAAFCLAVAGVLILGAGACRTASGFSAKSESVRRRGFGGPMRRTV